MMTERGNFVIPPGMALDSRRVVHQSRAWGDVEAQTSTSNRIRCALSHDLPRDPRFDAARGADDEAVRIRCITTRRARRAAG